MPTKPIYKISFFLGHFALNRKTIVANINETMTNLIASILKGPASFRPSLAATKALAHKKIKAIFNNKSIIEINKCLKYHSIAQADKLK